MTRLSKIVVCTQGEDYEESFSLLRVNAESKKVQSIIHFCKTEIDSELKSNQETLNVDWIALMNKVIEETPKSYLGNFTSVFALVCWCNREVMTVPCTLDDRKRNIIVSLSSEQTSTLKTVEHTIQFVFNDEKGNKKFSSKIPFLIKKGEKQNA